MSVADFRADAENHRIGQGGKFDWQGGSERYKWRVSAVRPLAQPVPQPGLKGTTGFVKPRSHVVRFLDAAAAPPDAAASRNAAGTSSESMKRAVLEENTRAKAMAGAKRKKISDAPLREGLFFDPQDRAWCGMHALNNYMLAPLVEQDDCRRAAHEVVQRLSEGRAGDMELMSSHLDFETGWLSIDVINVLGQANLGIHVESASTNWLNLVDQQGAAALVNWNQSHWTVLQRDPSGEGWMHTNSIEGAEIFMYAGGDCLMMKSSTYSLTSIRPSEIARCMSSRLLLATGIDI